MESLPSIEMQDYWNEVRTLRGVKKESMSEEDKSNDELEDCELDTTFFDSLGLSVSTSSQELSEEQVNTNTFMGTLTNRQEEALKRRVQTLNATLRQKRHRTKSNKPDIRGFFSSNDASSTGTRSRSATPDSLDSVSPPHTPPDPNPKTWVDPYLSRSRGSLDSGNHSLVTIPCYQPSSSPTTVTVSSFEPTTTLVTITNYQPVSNYHHQDSSYHRSDSNYQSAATDARTGYDNNGSTSIVTVSSYSNGSSSPVSSDANEGTAGQSRYIKIGDYPRNGGQENNNKYKYSRTYISQDGNTEPYTQNNKILIENNQRDNSNNRYPTNNTSSYSSNKSYVQSTHRSYSKSRSIKDTNEQQYVGNESHRYSRRPTVSPDYERDQHHADGQDWPDAAQRHSPQHRYVHYPEGRMTTLPRAPSLDGLANKDAPLDKPPNIRRQRSYAKDIAKDVKLYYTKGVYEFKPQAYHGEDPHREVQGLRYQHIGSMHIPRCRESRPSIEHGPSSHLQQDEADSRPLLDGSSTQSSTLTSRPREVRPRSSSTTDLGFKAVYNTDDEKFPELIPEVGRTGQTRMDWLHESDLLKLKSLALLELEIIFADHGISHTWRNNKKKKLKEAEHGVFGVSLPTLLCRDANNLTDPCQDSSVPQIFVKLLSHLQLHGLQEEGILRIPGNSSKTEALRVCLDTNFYSRPNLADDALGAAVPNELVAAIKLFLRMLPEPILTTAYMTAFHKAHKIAPLEERVVALTMLLLLLPCPHRATLRALLDLCAKVVEHESVNRMGLYNVATIMAPNLFPPKTTGSKVKLKNEDKDQLLEHARSSCELSQMLIKYRSVLWTVPNRLLGQIRRQYQATSASTPISRLLSRRTKEPTPYPLTPHTGGQGCVAKVLSPQLAKEYHSVHLTHSLTVRELINRLLEEEGSRNSSQRVEGRREQQRNGAGRCARHPSHVATAAGTWSSLPHPPALTCLLRGTKHAIQNHALHERGGNIGERRLDPEALLLAVWQDNPGAELILRCHHLGGDATYFRST